MSNATSYPLTIHLLLSKMVNTNLLLFTLPLRLSVCKEGSRWYIPKVSVLQDFVTTCSCSKFEMT